ncbi:MAG: TVP38/TMEM64 family protein [Planctomycetes bacterium]|nr:TVP38/TMEM64 family protein [Planctomycetota bacterium]
MEPESAAPPGSTPPELEAPRRLAWGWRLASLAPLALLGALYALSPAARAELDRGVGLLMARDLPGLRAWGAAQGAWAPLATTALMIAQALAAPIPAVLVTWTNSWLFGWVLGGLLSIAQATLAAWICFVLGQALGEPLLRRIVPEAQRVKLQGLLAERSASTVLVARLLPFVPFDAVSYLAGATGVRAWPFVWATFVGQLPAGFAYSYLGQEITHPGRLLVLGACTFAALVLIGVAARRRVASLARG